MGRNWFRSAFRLAQPSLLSAAGGPHFRRLQVVLSHTRDEPGGLDVVTIRAVPREGREVPTDQRRYGRFWD